MNEELATKEAEITDLKGKLESEKLNNRYISERETKLREQLDAIHSILDNLPNPPKRNDADNFPEDMKWKTREYSATERLAIWFGNR